MSSPTWPPQPHAPVPHQVGTAAPNAPWPPHPPAPHVPQAPIAAHGPHPVAAPAPSAVGPAPVSVAAAAASQPVSVQHREIRLRRAYEGFDGAQITVLRLRRPSTLDLRRNGYPLRNYIGPEGRVTSIEELPDVVARYIVTLADPPIPPTLVNQLDLEDFSLASQAVLDFFLG